MRNDGVRVTHLWFLSVCFGLLIGAVTIDTNPFKRSGLNPVKPEQITSVKLVLRHSPSDTIFIPAILCIDSMDLIPSSRRNFKSDLLKGLDNCRARISFSQSDWISLLFAT